MVPTTEQINGSVIEDSNQISLPDNAAVDQAAAAATSPMAASNTHHGHHNGGHRGHHNHHNHHHNHHHNGGGYHNHHPHVNGVANVSPPPPHHIHPMMHPHAHHHPHAVHHHPHHPHQMVMTAPPPMPHPNANFYMASQYTSLYVGDLSPEVNEVMLSELFSKVGRSAVASIHVCRDSVTYRSLGYAYVNFFNSIDAERALDTLNYSLVMGRPCRIMWSLRDPTKRKSNVGNIFVKNLDKQVDNAMLFDTFSKFGNILSCKIEYEKGVSKGYGYVHFESQEASERAIQNVNGIILCGKPIAVEQFVSKVERFKEKNEHKLFINNIDESASVEQLQAELSRFGEIESCIIRVDSNGKSKGLGFVEFKSVEDAQRLYEHTDPIEILSKPITIDRIKNKMERNIEIRQNKQLQQQQQILNNNSTTDNSNNNTNSTPSSPTSTSSSTTTLKNLTLFIHNIDESIDKELIREEFAKHGTILGIKIVQENGKNRGFGFLSYSTQEEANNAIEKMNGFILGSKPLSVSFSNRKYKKRMQQLQSNGSTSATVNGTSTSTDQQPQMVPQLPYVYFRNPYHHQGQVYHHHHHQPYYAHQMPSMAPQMSQQRYPKSTTTTATTSTSSTPTTTTGTSMTTPPPYKSDRTTRSTNGVPIKYNNNSNNNATTTNGVTTTTTNSTYNNGGLRKPRSLNPNHHNNHHHHQPHHHPRRNNNIHHNNQEQSIESSQPTTPPPETTTATSPVATTNVSFTLDSLLSMSSDDAKEILGTEIYTLVTAKYPSSAPKITGMIMSSLVEIKDLYELVISGKVHEKIDQAQSVLDSVQTASN